MNTRDVQRLFAYNQWANARLLAAAGRLETEEFTRDLGASFESLRGTLLHILWGEKRWLQRWQDGSRLPDADPTAFPNAGALAAAWSRLDEDRSAFAAGLTDERLATRLNIRGQEFTIEELAQHVLNHSTYHRGQVAVLLRQLGHSPPPTDYAVFLISLRPGFSDV